ncbi:hypothetical protein QJS04_geneDACA000745 [Acorus gramineus]|uniref:THH1/TOM1/TOM3 domain-containing protein n=1 Tax=Acorus gramineus TaxID=55184 RepID=A0AAV9BLH6_ACOGR|nr:hypothetical protein QJS04_geneDACA000745 [Acorus gramineus]
MDREMVHRMEGGRCLPSAPTVAIGLICCVDGAIATIAFYQLLRIQRRGQLGWTRQMILHLMIGTSSIGYVIYLISTVIASCEGWLFWLHGCGFILMACPQILFLAAFLLLLSFWVDLCHQATDEDDEDISYNEALLEKMKPKSRPLQVDVHRSCFPFQNIHVGSRQKFVILAVVLIFLLMITLAVLIWVGRGKNPINSSVVAQVYVDIFSIAIFLLGGALACYGALLSYKMSKVRSDNDSAEMQKVAGLAGVSVVCFTSSALVAFFTNIPFQIYYPDPEFRDWKKNSIWLFLYYFVGASVPLAFVLWEMRESPPPVPVSDPQSSIAAYVRDRPADTHCPQRWTNFASSQNQASRGSPI